MKKFSALLLLSTLCLSISPAAAQFYDEPPEDEDPGFGSSYESLLAFAEGVMDESCDCEELEAFTKCANKVAKKLTKYGKPLARMSDEGASGWNGEVKALTEDVILNCEYELEDPDEEEDPPMDE